jgi:endonuclease YncB( thermonuclease family)
MRALAFILVILASAPALAADLYPGPYRAEVLRIVDGDTLEARVAIWPDLETVVSVRLRGVDTPESYGPKCQVEKTLAVAATAFLDGLAPQGSVILLRDVGPDKYAGRVDARVMLEDGREAAAELLAAGHGRPYGGGKRDGWCAP